jgi:predicted nucleic acid-binding protein
LRIAFDSNLLIYRAKVWRAEGDREKTARVSALVLALTENATIIIPHQVLGETYNAMLRYGYARADCRTTVLDWADQFETAASSETASRSAIDLSTDHKVQFWDALILSVAAEAGCSLLLSEDLQPGFSWRGVTVVNPLAETLDERLVRILDAPR